MLKISYNSIMKNPSLCDGVGYRTVVFLQGCDIHCKHCQNQNTWDITKGHIVDVDDLAELIKETVYNNQITISGGEPLMQKEALSELLSFLDGYDICLYTGHDVTEIPQDILSKVHYVKYGAYKEEFKTTVMPFVGSSNQVFMEIKR